MKRVLLKFVMLMGSAGAVLAFICFPYRVSSNNMYPSVRDGDLCLISRIGEVYTKDIVLYEAEGNVYMGRILAKSGQVVDFPEEGGYLIDGYTVGDDILYDTKEALGSEITFPLTVPDDAFFVLNDFRMITDDSRQFGTIPRKNIIGKVFYLFRRREF